MQPDLISDDENDGPDEEWVPNLNFDSNKLKWDDELGSEDDIFLTRQRKGGQAWIQENTETMDFMSSHADGNQCWWWSDERELGPKADEKEITEREKEYLFDLFFFFLK